MTNNNSPTQQTKEDNRYVVGTVNMYALQNGVVQRAEYRLGFFDVKSAFPFWVCKLSVRHPEDFEIGSGENGMRVWVTYHLPDKQPINPELAQPLTPLATNP